MVAEIWQQNIAHCRRIVQQDLGPSLVNVVSGSEGDQEYWLDRLNRTRKDVFRLDGDVRVVSTIERTRKGNFLGSLNAWRDIKSALNGQPVPPVMVMNMVFGQGKRLSPFTQALANRKPAFPTPMRSLTQDLYLTTADIASFSTGLWLNHLETNGFRGIIVKWGDEAILPGMIWAERTTQYRQVDGIRFVWQTEPTEDLAREKEWVEFDGNSGEMTYQFTRQGVDTLQKRLAEHGAGRRVGVNLGSLGISYRLMEIAEQVFQDDLREETRWVDWDPYTWIAVASKNLDDWRAEAYLEDQLGKNGIRDLEARVPGFVHKIHRVREIFLERYGRLPVVKVLDFGEPFWVDWGLHLSLRRSLEALVTDSPVGITLRELFDLPQERDKNGNILVGSSIPSGADVRNSILVDTIITDQFSIIHGGLLVAGRHRKIEMPYGGSALFCAADEMVFTGPHAIAFKSVGDRLKLDEGDRLAQLHISDGALEMRTNESLVNYEGENYSQPVLGNLISFEEAARRMSVEDTRLVEKHWSDIWSVWLK